MGNNNIKSLTSRQAVSRLTTHLRTGARVSSPSSGVRPGARALNLELPTSFGSAGPSLFAKPAPKIFYFSKPLAFAKPIFAIFAIAFLALLGLAYLGNSAYAASYLNVSSGGAVSLGSIRPTSSGTSSTGSDTLTVHTDCSAGYSVYVSGQNGKDTNLTNNSAESNNTISASSNAIGLAGSLSSNTWGLNSENTGAYVGLPTYANATNKALTTKTSVAESSTVPIYYGIKVDTSITPGTYTGDVLYTVLPNSACTTYTVRFNANGGSGTMNNQTITVGKATNLTMNAFARSGYMFLGWATSSSATTPTYKDGESVTDITNFNITIDLYAIWGQSTGNMQDFQCTSLASGATTYLTDVRDNQVYSVYRIPVDQTYKDSTTMANIAGKCLMTKDLSLGYVTGGSITKGSNLTLTTTTSAASGTITARTSTSDWSTTNSDSNLQYINDPSASGNAYSQHSYYSYGAAQKVCPKGWRLPTSDEYATNTSSGTPTTGLSAIVGNSADGSSAIQAAPWSFVLGGGFYSSGWYNHGSSGYYWSSTQYSSTNGYLLYFNSSNVYRINDYKYRGRSVRCITEDSYTVTYSADGAESGSPSKTTEGTVYESGSVTMPTVGTMTKRGYEFKGWALTSGATEAAYTAEETVALSALLAAASTAGQTTTPGSTITLYPVWGQSIVYMQNWTGCATLSIGEAATLRDSRDGKDYTIKRLPDDKCWMMQNLTIGSTGPQTLTPKDTNIDDGKTYYLPPIGKQGSSTIDASSTRTATTTASFDSSASADKHARTQFRAKDSNIANDSDTVYYNFYTATLGFSSYDDGISRGTSTRDICPKGWRLPRATNAGSVQTVGSINDFTYLALQYENRTGWNGSSTSYSSYQYYNDNNAVLDPMYFQPASPLATDAPNNYAGFSYSGYWGWEYNSNVGEAGTFWSASIHNESSGYALYSGSGRIYPQASRNKFYGYAVRCLTAYDGTMQDFDASAFSDTIGVSAYLKDTRDGKVYAVKRLPDGKVWMVQNLALGMSATEQGLTLTPSDTNIDNDTTYYLPPAGKQGDITSSSTLTSSTAADFHGNANARTQFKNGDDVLSNDSDTGYYDFYTATLGFSYYYDNDVTSGSSTRDICPKGWRLPRISNSATATSGSPDSTGDFTSLANAYNLNASWDNGSTKDSVILSGLLLSSASPLKAYSPNNAAGLSKSGYWYGTNTSASESNSYGYYWTSSVDGTTRGYHLSISSSSVYPQSNGGVVRNKSFGFAVRCVAK